MQNFQVLPHYTKNTLLSAFAEYFLKENTEKNSKIN